MREVSSAAIGFGMLFFVLGMGEFGVGGICVLSLLTLLWLSVLIFCAFLLAVVCSVEMRQCELLGFCENDAEICYRNGENDAFLTF